MSDIFIKGDLTDLISSVESENVQLPQWLNIVDRKTESISENATSDNAMTQINNFNVNTDTSIENNYENSVTSTLNISNLSANFSTTSDNNDIFISQMGGNIEKTMASPDDINNLINMITSENVNENFNTVTTITNTSVLEDQLRELLTQAGGAKKYSKKTSKKSKKSKKSSKKSKKASKKSKKSSKKQKGGAKKKKASKKKSLASKKKASKKTASKKSSKKGSKKKKTKKYSKKYKGAHEESTEENVETVKPKGEKKKRAPNPGFTAFLELKKFVAKKLGIPNGIPAGKIAGMAKKEYTEQNEGISAEEASKGAMKYFEDNIEKFKDELKKIQK